MGNKMRVTLVVGILLVMLFFATDFGRYLYLNLQGFYDAHFYHPPPHGGPILDTGLRAYE